MANLEQNLTQYAAYHRDRRNIATHFAGVPMIVFAVVLALAPVAITGASEGQTLTLSIAMVAVAAASVYYLWLDLRLGLGMAATLFLMAAAAGAIVDGAGGRAAFGIAAATFVVGWAIQFVGHRYEGVKPAFFDDVKQLLIGPLFVLAEAVFLLGMRPTLRRYIEDRVGPVVARRDGRAIPIRDDVQPTFD